MEVVTRIVVRCWTSNLATACLEHIGVARCPLRQLLGLLLGHLGYVDTTWLAPSGKAEAQKVAHVRRRIAVRAAWVSKFGPRVVADKQNGCARCYLHRTSPVTSQQTFSPLLVDEAGRALRC